MPIGQPMREGQLLLFAARRWRILAIHDEDKVMELAPATGGVPAIAGLSSGQVHAVIRARMRAILAGDEQFRYLDPVAERMLVQARQAYAELRLDQRAVLRDGDSVLIVAWTGDRETGTLAQLLISEGLDATVDSMAVSVASSTESEVSQVIRTIAERVPAAEIELAKAIKNKVIAKYDGWLGDELLSEEYATTHLDCTAAVAAVQRIVDS
jgi:ATP-dependent Lhr-like helicase